MAVGSHAHIQANMQQKARPATVVQPGFPLQSQATISQGHQKATQYLEVSAELAVLFVLVSFVQVVLVEEQLS